MAGTERREGVLLGALVGVAFLLFGGAMAVGTVGPDIADAVAARGWTAVKGRLEGVRLETHRGRSSTTHEVKAAYSYDWEGRAYRGERVGISREADNIGSWQTDTYARLNADRRAGRPVTVWVDPDRPERAMLDRTPRPGLMALKAGFALVFVAVGLALLAMARRRPAPATIAEPDGPTDRGRTSNRIPSRAGQRIGQAAFFGVMALGLSLPGVLAIPAELRDGNPAILVVLLFTLVGLVMLGQAVRLGLEWQRFGAVEVVLDPFPGAVDGDVGGTIDLRLPYDPAARFEVSLSCHRLQRTSNRRLGETLLWDEHGVARTEPSLDGTRVRFLFRPPPGLPETDPPSAMPRHRWRLRLDANLPRGTLDRMFEIPVHRTGGVSSVRRAPGRPADVPVDLAELRWLWIDGDPGTLRLRLSPFRSPRAVLILGVHTMLFGVPAALGASAGGWGWLLAAACGLPALALLAGALWQAGNGLTTLASREGLRTERRWFGVPLGRRRMEARAVDRLLIDETLRIGGGGARWHRHLRVGAVGTDGARLTLADALPSEAHAERLRAMLEAALRRGR